MCFEPVSASALGASVIAAESAGPLAILGSTGAAAASSSTFLGMTAAQLSAASLGLSAVGTGAQVFGQIQSGRAASATARFQSAVARNNAILAERGALDAEARGKIAEQQAAEAGKKLKGRQRVVLAANGVEVDTGSALDITSDTAEQNRFDQLTIRSNAEREALGFRSQSMNFENEATLASLRGKAGLSAGMTGAFGTALTGAGSVAKDWYLFNKER